MANIIAQISTTAPLSQEDQSIVTNLASEFGEFNFVNVNALTSLPMRTGTAEVGQLL